MIDSTLTEGGHSSRDAAVANPLSFGSNRGALPLSSQGRIGRLKRNLETKAAVTVYDVHRILEGSALGRLQSAERAMPTHDNDAKATNLLSA